MFLVCFILLVGGMWVLSQAFVIDAWQGPVFVLGVLLVALGWGIAMRPLRGGNDIGRPDPYAPSADRAGRK